MRSDTNAMREPSGDQLGERSIALWLVRRRRSLPSASTAKNPQVQYFEPTNGYLVCEVTPDGIAADFRYVTTVADADSPVTSGATFVVSPGVDGAAPTATRT